MNTVGEAALADSRAPSRLRVAVCWATIVSCVPYLSLKLLWLAGFSSGAATAAGAAELGDVRHTIGNVVTVGMELAAVALVLALTYPWGHRVPAALLAAPIWVAGGLLAPIVIGLPLGLLAQAFTGGSAAPAGNGLESWVYVLVYGGFIMQAVGLVTAFVAHARARWPNVFRMPAAELPEPTPAHRRLSVLSAGAATGYAVILAVWSVAAPAWGAPAGLVTVTQRSALLATGLLVLAGAVAVLSLLHRRGQRRVIWPLVLAWIGSAVTVTAGPTHLVLSNNGNVSTPQVVVSLAATLAGLALTASAWRAFPRRAAV
ncbi:hypothetical protein [Actinokineospora fastidiosa]|uniref:LigA protein n=1 Tax=Actinokineospora fastidiosa TaxID=1816 RepID=A0A918GN00_9PSEU|nr:hypothetical protein [Actinokineospora fastidiosa]GGS46417.1 hypothetical protein GCM10010171_47030 [Actinokineospora fastidiosa]